MKKYTEVESREQCVCGAAGMRECPVSHNSAKLEVKRTYCGQACFSHLGRLGFETRSSDLIELLSLRVDELDVASRRHVCPIYLRMFRKQREAAGNSTCCISRDFIFH